MNGRKRRELRSIFASFERKQEAQFAHRAKMVREELIKTAKEVEEFIGTEDLEIVGETRDELMIYIDVLLNKIAEYSDITLQLEAEAEYYQTQLAAQEELLRMQQELIVLYQQLSSAQNTEQEELKAKIDELTKQVDELNTRPKPRHKRSSDASAQELLNRSAERLRRYKARIEKEQEELRSRINEEANNERESTDTSSAGFDEGSNIPPVQDDPVETDTSNGENEEHPSSPPEEPPVELPPEDEGAGSGDPVHSDSEPPVDGENTSDDKTNASPENEYDSREILQAKIKKLEEELKLHREREAEWNYQAKKGSTDSNTPPGKEVPWKTRKASSTDSSEKSDAKEASGDETNESDEIARMEAEAEEAALHDPNKSPNQRLGGSGRRGKPVGSAGGGRTMPEYDEKRVHKCNPDKCVHCPHRNTCQAFAEAEKDSEKSDATSEVRHVYDIEFRRIVTEYRRISCICPENGETVSGSFPEGVNNWFQYGLGIKALVITLNTVGMVSYERIADIVKGMMNDTKFCGKTACNWVGDFAEQLAPVGRYIKAGVFSGNYLHCDESGVKVKGILHWVHVACNLTLTYMRVDRQRGDSALKHIGVVSAYVGTIISDCWSCYWDKGARHGLCNAHILRELFALVKFFERDKVWAQKMMDLLNEMNDERDKLIAAGITEFSPEVLENFYMRYDAIVKEGLGIHPDGEAGQSARGKAKKYRGRNLLDRLVEKKDNVLLFLVDFDVEFTNNLAERSLRMFSVKRTVVGGFDTYEGADGFALIWSYISSARKHDLSAYSAIKAALEGNAVEYLFGEEEIKTLDEVLPKLTEINIKQFLADRAEDREAIRKATEDAHKKRISADKAKEAAKLAEEKYRAAQLKADQLVTERTLKRVERALIALEKAQKTVVKKEVLSQEASEKAADIYEWARVQAKAAMHFLEIENFVWDFDTEMAV